MENKAPLGTDVVPILSRITEQKLTASNYSEWAKTIRIYLRSIEKDDHLTKDSPQDSKKQAWLRDDSKLFLQIRNSINPEVMAYINHCEFVKELMEYLEFIYSGKGNISHTYDVCKAFYRPEKLDKSLMTYFMEFKKAYEDLNTLLPFTTDIKVQMKQREEMAVMSWLSGLPPEYDGVKSQILTGTEISSLQEVYARLLRSEGTHSQPSSNVSALVSHGGSKGGGASNSGGTAHNRSKDSGGIVCYYCHEQGHTKHNCKKLQKKQ